MRLRTVCTDKTLASNLFSAEFGEQPNIVHSRRLGNPSSTTGQKPRPLLVSFDNSHTAEHFVANAKVRAGLTMVPNVPWHRAPRRKGPPAPRKNFF